MQQVLLGSLGTGAGGIALNRQLLQLLLEAARQPCLGLGALRRERRQPLLGARRILGGVRGAACLQQSGALALGPLDPARQSLGAGPRLLLTQQQALERAARGEHPRGQLLVQAASLGQRALGREAPVDRRL